MSGIRFIVGSLSVESHSTTFKKDVSLRFKKSNFFLSRNDSTRDIRRSMELFEFPSTNRSYKNKNPSYRDSPSTRWHRFRFMDKPVARLRTENIFTVAGCFLRLFYRTFLKNRNPWQDPWAMRKKGLGVRKIERGVSVLKIEFPPGQRTGRYLIDLICP